jgi:hypothetical protein
MPENSSPMCACRIEDRNTNAYSLAGDRLRQADHARQRARRLHDRRARAAPEGVAARQLDREVEALVEHARETGAPGRGPIGVSTGSSSRKK